MKFRPIEHGLVMGKPAEGYVRSPGLHMSDIYGSLYKALMPKRYDKRDSKGDPLPFNQTYMELGSAFEEVLEPALRDRLLGAERPGEFTTLDGTNVIYSPDQFIFQGGKFYLGEFKLTWMTNTSITDPKFDKWLCQMKAYCFHLETPYALLYAFFVNGSGWTKGKADSGLPQLTAWEFEFSAKELSENWQTLKRHAERTGLLPFPPLTQGV